MLKSYIKTEPDYPWEQMHAINRFMRQAICFKLWKKYEVGILKTSFKLCETTCHTFALDIFTTDVAQSSQMSSKGALNSYTVTK